MVKINNRMMETITKLVAEVKGKSFTEQGMLTHKLVLAMGEGVKLPITGISGALNKHGAVMYKVDTILPSPVFINIQNNFLKKNTPAQVAKTDKLFHIEKELSVFDYNRLLNLYRKAVTGSTIAAVADIARKNTGYMFTGELLKSFEVLEKDMNIDLKKAGKKILSLEKDTTKAKDLPKEELDFIKLMTPENSNMDDIIQITKWMPLEVPEGTTIPVYSTGVYKRSHWENFNLSMFAPYKRTNCFWRVTYTNLDNNTDQEATEAAKLTKAVRELKKELNIK